MSTIPNGAPLERHRPAPMVLLFDVNETLLDEWWRQAGQGAGTGCSDWRGDTSCGTCHFMPWTRLR